MSYLVQLTWDNIEAAQIEKIREWYERKLGASRQPASYEADDGWYTITVTHRADEESAPDALEEAFALAPMHILTEQKLREIHVREERR